MVLEIYNKNMFNGEDDEKSEKEETGRRSKLYFKNPNLDDSI